MKVITSYLFAIVFVFFTFSEVYSFNTTYLQNVGANVNPYANGSHHFFLGNPNPPARQIYKEFVIRPSSWFRVQSVNVTYPPNNTYNYNTISAIMAWDQYRDGRGGYATLVSGGIGHKHMTLNCKSQRGKGMSFIVQVYGY